MSIPKKSPVKAGDPGTPIGPGVTKKAKNKNKKVPVKKAATKKSLPKNKKGTKKDIPPAATEVKDTKSLGGFTSLGKPNEIVFTSEEEFIQLAGNPENVGKTLVPSAEMEQKGFRRIDLFSFIQDSGPHMEERLVSSGLPTPVYFINGDRVGEKEGREVLAKVKKSQPYVLKIRNAANSAVDVSLFNPDYSHPDILIETGYPKIVSYKEMLRQFIASPFTVGQSYVVIMDLASGETNKMLRHITVITKDANSTVISIPLIICKDPYQMQNAIAIIDQEFRIDTLTYLEFTMPPLTILHISLYPSDNVNLARMLADKNAVRDFGNPDIIKPQMPISLK